jgi:hypothetical protein
MTYDEYYRRRAARYHRRWLMLKDWFITGAIVITGIAVYLGVK